MNCAELEKTSAYFDGELNEEAAARAERHLQTCPHCQAMVTAAEQARHLMGDPNIRWPAPEDLKFRIARALEAQQDNVVALDLKTPRQKSFWFGAASGAGAAAVAACLIAVVMPNIMMQALADRLTDDHVTALMNGRSITVVSSDHHTVKPWFAGRTPFSPPVSDFADEGFTLKGARMDRVAGRATAVLVYQHGAHQVDLFVWLKRGGAASTTAVRRGYHLILWTGGDLDFAAVSDVNQGELARFQTLVQSERE